MSELSVMIFDEGFDRGIRCGFINEWIKKDFYLPSKERLLSEIERNKADVVIMNLDLYSRIDGIETSRQIRYRFDVPIIYV